MAILSSCCCCRSVRNGSFACGIYTLVFYTIIVTACAFHVHTVKDTPDILRLSIIMLVLSGFCVFSSVLLLVGLCVENHFLLLPWIIAVAMTTVLDVVISVYLFSDMTNDPFLCVLLVIDYAISGLNVYCILCVFSQFQKCLAERNVCNQHITGDVPVLNIQSPSQDDSKEACGKTSFIPNGDAGATFQQLVAPNSSSDRRKNGNDCFDHRRSISSQQNESQLTYQEDIVKTEEARMNSFSRQETEELEDVTPIENDQMKSFVCYIKKSSDRLESISSTVLLVRAGTDL